MTTTTTHHTKTAGLRVPMLACARAVRTTLTASLLLSILLSFTGCGITKPAGASFASVTLKGKSFEDIRSVSAQVFQENEYRVLALQPQMVFEKEGSQMQTLAYSGVVAAHEGQGVAVRVRAQMVSMGPDTLRLQCQAYVVRSPHTFFEEEQRLPNRKGWDYQMLLNKVASRLK
jgi:hypothetical protein